MIAGSWLRPQPSERAPDFGVGEHDRRLALQRVEVAAGEAVSVFGRGQQLLDLIAFLKSRQ